MCRKIIVLFAPINNKDCNLL